MTRTAAHALALRLGDDPWLTLGAAVLRVAVNDARRGDAGSGGLAAQSGALRWSAMSGASIPLSGALI